MGDISASGGPRPRGGLRWAVLAALAVALLGLCPGLGLPGAVLYEFTNRLVFGGDPWAGHPPDGAWPLAIYLSLLWPLAIPPGYLLARRAHSRWAARLSTLAARLFGWGAGTVVLLGWGTLLALSAYPEGVIGNPGGRALATVVEWLTLGLALVGLAATLRSGWREWQRTHHGLTSPVAGFIMGPTAAAALGRLWRRWRPARRAGGGPHDDPPAGSAPRDGARP